jgi:hypothetical protein
MKYSRQQIFENLPNDIRPGWAGLILLRFDHYTKDISMCWAQLDSTISEI